MLQLQQQKQSSHLPNELQQLEQRIAYADASINKKVYALYGLSEEEVRVVEGGAWIWKGLQPFKGWKPC